MRGPLRLDYASRTDPGRVRTNNEDCVVAEPALGLALLADGMGGHQAGEVASGMVAQAVTAYVASHLQAAEDPAAMLVRAAQLANRMVFDAAAERPECAGMGTTLVAALFVAGRTFIAHAGDSRAYRLRDGQLALLTRDHTTLQQQIDAGLLPTGESRALHANLLTRALGVRPEVELAVQEEELREGDLYLLCSDGLTDSVHDPMLEALLLAPDGDLAQRCEQLVWTARDYGGEDNISAILVAAHTETTDDPLHRRPSRLRRFWQWLRGA